MFSSISNFLPAALHSSSPQKTVQIRQDDDDDDDDPGSKSDPNADETSALKKKKDKTASETFIFVRPPPAKSNHPLNLQVQLVPPNARGPSGLTSASRQSLDISASAPTTPSNSAPATPQGASLTRTASNRSTASSTYSSTSTTSTASTASSRRMIVPLYNLQAHNVMTNIIVDAGTDAKIARFTKRGIEMLDLAVLEPVEVYKGGGAPTHGGEVPVGASSGFSTHTVGGRPSMSGGGGLLVPGSAGSRPGTPDHHTNSSQASLASSSAHSHEPHEPGTHAETPQTQTPQGKRNLFGKLFKKKDAAGVVEGGGGGGLAPPPTTTGRGHSRTLSALSARSVSPNPPRTSMSSAHRSSIDLAASPGGAEDAVAPGAVAPGRAPVLGLLPGVSSPVHPPKGRPGLYVWVVKRWLKGDFGGGLLAAAKGMVKGQGGGDGDLTGEVEVRFEWKRGKGKARRRREREHKGQDRERGGDGEDGEHHQQHASRRQGSTANLGAQSKRLSISAISRQSSFSTMAASEDGHAVERQSVVAPNAEEDLSGEESDPEDSETPWTCTVKEEVVDPIQAEHDRAQWKKEVVRIKVGTMSPTPHHPKVVAMLKVPFPLPDVDVEHMVVRKRDHAGHAGPLSAINGHGLVITAEEIKDVVCSTGLWLVVRESFGGIGKVSRKGDGWRIRG
ncbi:hypothetical protein B0H11DRAFT_1819749 [Mycena galericulata]|nr:hypothetical protein B0H11DRAFT_1819743 [Mycena galericulata]KAJ7454974.1 hypothetical protein B0H11DRAFT_1875096 [Mycena galericulata]KAJ7454976.1 hypothetical protein B0H11DRAFT_1819749 [Mycena galericulata]